MTEQIVYILIALFLVICTVAGWYIKHHYQLLQQAKRKEQQEQKKAEQRYSEQRAYLIESIQVIAKAVGNDEKLSYTEACMRLNALLEALSPQLLLTPEVMVIREVYKQTEHIPIKEQWKALSKQQRWAFKKEMAKVEQEHGEQVLAAAGYLARYDFNLLIH